MSINVRYNTFSDSHGNTYTVIDEKHIAVGRDREQSYIQIAIPVHDLGHNNDIVSIFTCVRKLDDKDRELTRLAQRVTTLEDEKRKLQDRINEATDALEGN